MRQKLIAILGLILILILSGCGQQHANGSSSGTSSQDTEPLIQEDGDLTVYSCGDVKIALPTKYLDQLIVKTEFEPGTWDTCLLSVSEKASYEAGKADGMEGMGWLFSINQLTRAQYEQYLSYDHSGQTAFAVNQLRTDERYTASVADTYYVYCTATDVQFYRSGGVIDTDSQDWKDWEALCEIGDTIRSDMIARNGLTVYSDDQVLNQEFTYTGSHLYFNYYPYFTVDGSKDQYDTLVLSQPAKQGEGGIWCVERFYDEYGNCYLYYCGGNASDEPQQTTAAAYYAAVQKACDDGTATEDESALLIPRGAAKTFVLNSGWGAKTISEESLMQTDGLNSEYYDLNQGISKFVSSLCNGDVNNPDALIDYIGRFTPETWGVLGRNHYGSDWWTPLEQTLRQVAVGSDQDIRCRNMIHLYLSYSGSTPAISQGLADVLSLQQQSDNMVFSNVLSGFSASEQQKVQAALAR